MAKNHLWMCSVERSKIKKTIMLPSVAVCANLPYMCLAQCRYCCQTLLQLMLYDIKDNGKAIPLQARTGPEASRRLRIADFKTIGT
jgi:hypothetical protein